MTDKRRSISLDAIGADGWLERLSEESEDLATLSDVMGAPFVAFSFLAGVRVTAVTVDRRSPEATLVDFVVGDEEAAQRLALGEFRRRLVAALLAGDDPMEEDLPAGKPDAAAVHALIGVRYVLLAPLFGIRLSKLIVGASKPAVLVVQLESGQQEVTLGTFREAIRERVRLTLRQVRSDSPFSIDLAALPDAEAAIAREDYATAVELLAAWPGPLSMLLRTPEAAQLGAEVRATLARALALLGTAYAKTARFDWADEVMRLGIQWAQDGPAAADLFRRLGEAHVDRGRHGEAIGLLRRASALGAPEHAIAHLLARAYSERERHVAACICAEEAMALGVEVESMTAIRARAMAVLGESWTRLRELVPGASTTGSTVPPRGAGG